MANVYEPDFDAEQDRPPFRWRRARLGRQAGSRALGASLFELPPDAATFPLHAHHGNEELIVVISGRPTLRGLGGERELSPGEVVACPSGRAGAHRIDNRSTEPARVLIVSTMNAPDLAEYPDSGKVLARNWPPGGPMPADPVEVIVRAEDSVDYFAGETDTSP